MDDLARKLLAKTEIIGDCWVWTGGRNRNGYGHLRWEGREQYVHRLAHQYLIGPIPETCTVDHVQSRGCAHRACWNPAHLEAVPHRENVLRGDTIPARNLTKTHCPYGHPYIGENLYVRKNGSRECRICCRTRNQARAEAQRIAAC